MDGAVVDAVLRAAGHRPQPPARRTGRPDRRARSRCCDSSPEDCRTSQIGARLVISPKTAGNHVEHIYTKIAVTNRAAAALYAMQHGLLPDTDD